MQPEAREATPKFNDGCVLNCTLVYPDVTMQPSQTAQASEISTTTSTVLSVVSTRSVGAMLVASSSADHTDESGDDGDWGTIGDAMPLALPNSGQLPLKDEKSNLAPASPPLPPPAQPPLLPLASSMSVQPDAAARDASVAVPNVQQQQGVQARVPATDAVLLSPDAYRHVTSLLTSPRPPGVARAPQDVQRLNDALIAAMKARETSDRLVVSLESQVL
jgi:hypothetical protein